MNIFFKKNKIGIVLTLLILILGSIGYFYFASQNTNKISNGMGANKNGNSLDPTMFNNMNIKVAYTPDGNLKLFVNAKNNDLAKLKVMEGNSIPEVNTIIVGYDEAMMMKEEKLFTSPGDKIENLFGINVTIGGVISKTDSIVDDMHFLSEINYKNLIGEENRLFIKLDEVNATDLIYNYPLSKNVSLKFKLAEGSLENYKIQSILGKTYYPILLGFKDAKEMREQGEFKKIGDTMDFFNKEVIVVGIIEETNTSLDMMHLVPLIQEDLS